MNTIKILAGISFFVFCLWTLRGDKIDEDGKKKSKFGPIVTVAIAFFLAKMGVKFAYYDQVCDIALAKNTEDENINDKLTM